MGLIDKWRLAADRALSRATVAKVKGDHERAKMHLALRRRMLARVARMEGTA
jgi:hypothetical protein